MSGQIPDLIGKQDGTEIRFQPGDGRNLIGRGNECDLVLAHPTVSRKHAALLRDGDQVTLEDLGSHNGTRVNGATVNRPTTIKPGDSISIADINLQFGEAPNTNNTVYLSQAEEVSSVAVPWDEVHTGSHQGHRKRKELFRCLASAGDLIAIPRAPEELFEPILDLVESAMDPERAFLLLTDDTSEEPVIHASRLASGSDGNVTLSRTVVGKVIEERTSFLLEDGDDSLLSSQHSIVYQGIRSAMACPLFDNKDVIGILYADTTDPQRKYDREELVAFSLLANVIAVALTHARYDAMEMEKQRLDTELDAARTIMQTIVSDELPQLPGYSVRAHSEPCFEVGGDLYDVSKLPDGRVALVVGDASGKGLGAALLVSSLVPLLRAMLELEPDLCSLASNLNRQLWRTTDPVRYCTLFFGLLDPVTGRLEYVNAGHNAPYLLRRDGTLESVDSTGMPVALVEEGQWHRAELTLEPGDMIALYSDGIPETWHGEEEEYGDERFQELLVRLHGRSLGEIRDATLTDVDEFRGETPVSDDLTLVLLQREA